MSMRTIVFSVAENKLPYLVGTKVTLTNVEDIKKETIIPVGNPYIVSQFGGSQLLKAEENKITIKKVTKTEDIYSIEAEMTYLGTKYKLIKKDFTY
nr:MAG TPA: hypothetical protein [Caudoviricetes sp.]